MKLIIAALFAVSCFAQSTVTTLKFDGPPPNPAFIHLYFNDGTNVKYGCFAQLLGPDTTTWLKSDSTITNIVVTSNVATITFGSAHNIYESAVIVISGATVDTDLNGTYSVLDAPNTTTVRVTTENVGNATYTESTLKVTTNSPLLTASRWGISLMKYDTGNFVTSATWAFGAVAPQNRQCSKRANY